MTGISRRALLSGTAAFGAGALAGCAGMNTAQPRGVGPLTNLTKEPVRLRFGVRPGATELAWATVIAKDFQRMHPNITVAVEQNAQITDIRTLVTGALSRDLPDIMFTTDVNVQTQSSKGLLLDLTPYMQAYGMKQSDFLGKIMQLGQWKGRQYVVPRGADQVIVAYNPETFTKAGLPQPRLGWRWPEFLRACAQLQRKNGHGFWAMGDGATYTGYPIFIPFMRGWGGEVANADGSHATLDSPKVVEGVAQMMDFFGKYSAAFQA
ncbi:MAG: extracellular solute-binding protein, partial [Mycobacterium sp.]|nr:extracellular solute-binding protein [Mycobacterium sp.]